MLRPSEWLSSSNRIPVGLFHYVFPLGIDKDRWSMSSGGVRTTDSILVKPVKPEWVGSEQEVKRILVELFKTIPQVKSICAQFDAEEIIIWTLLESYNREAREKVYEKELELCEKLNLYDFDFRVTSIGLISSDELIQSGSHEIYRRQ